LLHRGIVALLGFAGPEIADRLKKPSGIEQIGPFGSGKLDYPDGASLSEIYLELKGVARWCLLLRARMA